MKNIKSILLASLAVLAVGLTVQAADILRMAPVVNQVYAVVDSAGGANTNLAATYATNGFYPQSIVNSINVTNHIVIPVVGNNLALQFNAGALGGASTAILTLKYAVTPPKLTINNGGVPVSYGMGGWTNSSPMTPFATITLATTGTGIQSTNVFWSSSTTPQIGAIPYVIIEKITAGATYDCTNYSVWVNNR
jgi:hypothetical protein